MIVVNSPFSPADLDYDSDVDIADLLVFIDSWLSEEGDYYYNLACDFNDDSTVNLHDFAVFAGDWNPDI